MEPRTTRLPVVASRGRKPEIAEEVVEAIVHDTLHARPDDDPTRLMAERNRVGQDTVARI